MTTGTTRAYTFRPLPPLRSLIIGGAGLALGAVLIIGGHAANLGWVLAIGVVAAVAGAALIVAAWVLALRRGVRVVIDDDALLARPIGGAPVGIAWGDIVRVEEARDTLVVHQRVADGERTLTIDAPGTGFPSLDLARDIADHLDRDRGYANRLCEVGSPAEAGVGAHACENPLGCAGSPLCQLRPDATAPATDLPS